MIAAYQATGDKAYMDYVTERHALLADIVPFFKQIHSKGGKIDVNVRRVVEPHALDDAGAVCCSMIKSLLRDAKQPLRPLIDNYADYIMNKEYRLSDGTFARLRPQKNTVWLDDMFMGIPTVAYMGRLTGDGGYYDEAARQVGLIDTTQTWLKIQQMDATKAVYQSQKPDMERQIAATRQQLAKAQQDEQRYRELVADGAAPSKMFDDATSQVKVLQKQLDAQISSLSTSTQALDKQMAAAEIQKAQLQDMLRKCHILTPIKGIILEKYVEQGEFVSVGKPLFKIADTESMKLRAYVTSAQLQNLKIGQKVKVFANYGDGQRKEYAGTISWISSRSEFTPKTILTDDERADLVYAVKVAIKNDGFVKIGMYGEVKLSEK